MIAEDLTAVAMETMKTWPLTLPMLQCRPTCIIYTQSCIDSCTS